MFFQKKKKVKNDSILWNVEKNRETFRTIFRRPRAIGRSRRAEPVDGRAAALASASTSDCPPPEFDRLGARVVRGGRVGSGRDLRARHCVKVAGPTTRWPGCHTGDLSRRKQYAPRRSLSTGAIFRFVLFSIVFYNSFGVLFSLLKRMYYTQTVRTSVE